MPEPFTCRDNNISILAGSRYNINNFPVLDGDYKVLIPGVGSEERRTLIKVVKRALNERLVRRMTKGIKTIKDLNKMPRGEKKKRERVISWSYHIGSWTPMLNTQIVATAMSSQLKGIEQFMKKMVGQRGLRRKVEGLVCKHFPDMAARYTAVTRDDPDSITSIFRTVAINIDGESKPHVDSKDYDDGFCLVMPFGSYEGTSN